MKNEAANAPITFEELAMVMIKPHYKTRTYGRGNHSNKNVQIGIKGIPKLHRFCFSSPCDWSKELESRLFSRKKLIELMLGESVLRPISKTKIRMQLSLICTLPDVNFT